MTVLIVLLLLGLLLSIGFTLYLIRSSEKTRRLLVDREKAREDFIDMTVHELRAPLTAIKDASSMLVTMPDLPKEQQSKLMTMVHDQTKMLLEQVNAVLDLAKINQGKLKMQLEKSDIIDLIKKQMQFFFPQAQKKNITIASDLHELIPPFQFDKTRIAQVINNILSNSLKYTQEGGEIIIKALSRTDTVPTQVMVTIKDNGPGIPQEQQTILFQKFAQTNESHHHPTLKLNSSGLGLYIARGIIEAHGGTITLQSEEGKGTTVVFTLPMVA